MLAKRKAEHLDICLRRNTRSGLSTGLEHYTLKHQPLPEFALDDVDTHCSFLGHQLGLPLLVSAMTGGTSEAWEVNRRLAAAAQELGLAMGLGSQRAGLKHPELMQTYQVRDVAPDIVLLANLGAVQLNYGYGIDDCRRAIDTVQANALVLHLNPLQEAVQPEGDTNFRGLLARIERLCKQLPVPVIVKEVGWGLDGATAKRLFDAGVYAVDIAGAGGTSWSQVERHRSATPDDAQIAAAFEYWGIPTAESLRQVVHACPDREIIASGGISNGVEAALCIAMGARLAGMAQALLAPAMSSQEDLGRKLGVIARQFRIAMFACGARTVSDLAVSQVETVFQSNSA